MTPVPVSAIASRKIRSAATRSTTCPSVETYDAGSVAAGHERVVEQGRGEVGAGLGHQPGEERRHGRQVGAEAGVGRHQQLAEVAVEVGQPTLEGERLDALLGVSLQHDARVDARVGRRARQAVAGQRPAVVEPAGLLHHLTFTLPSPHDSSVAAGTDIRRQATAATSPLRRLEPTMRILCTFVGGLGHLAPLLPLARAAQAAGHEVAIAGSGGLVPRIEEAGFRAFATSPPPHHSGAPTARDLTPLDVMDARATELEFAQNFGDRGARRMAGAVPALIEDFRPDLVLRDETDLGTTIAAELLGVPVATHLVLASGLLVRPELVGPQLDAVRAEHGLPPDPGLTRLTSGLVLSDFPPSFRSPASPLRLEPTHYRSVTAPRPLEAPGGRSSTSPSAPSSTRRPAISSSVSWPGWPASTPTWWSPSVVSSTRRSSARSPRT